MGVFSRLIDLDYMPRWAVLMLDMLLVLVAFAISYAVGSNLFRYNTENLDMSVWQQAVVVLGLQLLFCLIFRTYAGILRFSTFVDTIKVAASVLLVGLILIVFNVLGHVSGYVFFLNTTLIVYVFVAIVLLVALRIGVKTLFEYVSHQSANAKKVLIYGVQSPGLSIAKMLQSNMESEYRPVGFISDDAKPSHDLLGMKVYPRNKELISTMQSNNVNCVIVSPLKMRTIDPLTDLNIFFDNGIQVLTTPYFKDYSPELEGEEAVPQIGRIESIKVEDLLERPTININTGNVSRILRDKVIMITGAAGSIGSEIVRQVSAYNPRLVVLFEMAESPLHDLTQDLRVEFPNLHFARRIADVRSLESVREAFEEYHPDVVFHAAAYKHVPLMEEFPTQAVLANVLGTRNVADMAVKYGVDRFVMISTDKAVNPTNVMGASKRIAEIYVQALNNKLEKEEGAHTKFITTRFGNVLGSNGSVVPYFKKQIAAGGPVTVTHPDIIRYFMTIPEASTLVLEAATLGNGGEIFCFDMGHPVKIADLARNMIRLAGYVPGRDIQIVFTGLRPGEKLYEELLNQKEITKPTPNEKIMIAQVRESEYAEVSLQIDKLIELAQSGKSFPTVSEMKNIVPEFKSKNSIFERLD